MPLQHSGSRLNLNRLRMLVELRDHGTISEVADIFLMTHSAVSQQLTRLEKDVGYSLLEKNGRSLRLTDKGKILADYADRMLTLADEAMSVLASQQAVEGHLRIAAFQSALVGLAPLVSARLRELHPELTLEFLQYDVAEGMLALKKERVDIVIGEELPLAANVDFNGVHRLDLYEEPLVLVTPTDGTYALDPAVARTFQDYAQVPFLLNPADTVAGQWERVFCMTQGLNPLIVVETPDPLLQLELVRAGMGVAILPSLVLTHAQNEVSVRALPTHPTRTLFTAVRTGRQLHPSIQAFRLALSQVADT
ncbi:LysR family transcriptional regulator [Corynebacterium sp. HS2168-gen11]|uniref:LysR family transcriptional regulator n=1 Tax=Corynebacterium sp. HS2168-gen11 TaxID=2974027 RepID=UPI00216B2A73|nr:LysR family transcriptional regulator [Corynebacterium sp. HS2168-gen11]MCS4535914.1 LysR family transcriptional regulator [Corynebacterium sp. HS2168-gen11]